MGVVLLADLLFQGEVHPWAGDGNPFEWVQILERVLQTPAETYVPGHGIVSGRQDVEQELAYMRDFAALVERHRQQPELEVAVPEPYRTWEGEEWFKRGLSALTS